MGCLRSASGVLLRRCVAAISFGRLLARARGLDHLVDGEYIFVSRRPRVGPRSRRPRRPPATPVKPPVPARSSGRAGSTGSRSRPVWAAPSGRTDLPACARFLHRCFGLRLGSSGRPANRPGAAPRDDPQSYDLLGARLRQGRFQRARCSSRVGHLASRTAGTGPRSRELTERVERHTRESLPSPAPQLNGAGDRAAIFRGLTRPRPAEHPDDEPSVEAGPCGNDVLRPLERADRHENLRRRATADAVDLRPASSRQSCRYSSGIVVLSRRCSAVVFPLGSCPGPRAGRDETCFSGSPPRSAFGPGDPRAADGSAGFGIPNPGRSKNGSFPCSSSRSCSVFRWDTMGSAFVPGSTREVARNQTTVAARGSPRRDDGARGTRDHRSRKPWRSSSFASFAAGDEGAAR